MDTSQVKAERKLEFDFYDRNENAFLDCPIDMRDAIDLLQVTRHLFGDHAARSLWKEVLHFPSPFELEEDTE